MSYTFYSFRSPNQQDAVQWQNRNLKEETESCYARTLVEIFNHYLNNPSAKILEAGCGIGGWVNYFRRRGFHIIGVDYDRRVARKAREEDPSIPIFVGDIRYLPFPDNSFDAYISLGVIEHFFEGPIEALVEARRVLKPGGMAFITVPYLTRFRQFVVHPIRDLFFTLWTLNSRSKYFWEYRYTAPELMGFLKEAGLHIQDWGVDDYSRADIRHHIGLYADFFFLRSKKGKIWELNLVGKLLLALLRSLSSDWFFCSGLHIVARNPN